MDNNTIYYFILFCKLQMHGKNKRKVVEDYID